MVPCQRKGRPSSKRSQVSVWVPKTINGMAQESSSGCLSIPLSRASAPVAWRSWYLGFFFMASSACQGHKQHEEEFQMGIPKGWTWPCVPHVCAMAAWQWRRDLVQSRRNLKIPEAPSTWILPQRMKPESWQQIPGKICLPSWPAHKGRRASKVFRIFGEGEIPGEEQQAQLDGPRCWDCPSKSSTSSIPAWPLLPDANVPCGHMPWVQASTGQQNVLIEASFYWHRPRSYPKFPAQAMQHLWS